MPSMALLMIALTGFVFSIDSSNVAADAHKPLGHRAAKDVLSRAPRRPSESNVESLQASLLVEIVFEPRKVHVLAQQPTEHRKGMLRHDNCHRRPRGIRHSPGVTARYHRIDANEFLLEFPQVVLVNAIATRATKN